MIGSSPSHAASNLKISAEKVFPHQVTCGSGRLGQAVRRCRARSSNNMARLPEVLVKEGKGLLSEVDPGFDPEPIHFCFRRRPNAVELLDRQSFDEGRPHLRCNDEEA